MMSIEMKIIDLTEKKIYDIAGGRNLYWMLPFLKGHNICIEAYASKNLGTYADLFEDEDYEKINAWELPTSKKNVISNILEKYPILDKEFHSIRYIAGEITMMLNNIYDPDMCIYDDTVRADITTEIKKVLPNFEAGYAEDVCTPYYTIASLADLFKIGLLFVKDSNEDYDLYKEVSEMNYEFIV